MENPVITPINQWTNNSDKVLLVKCVNKDMTSYNGFTWPQSGPVKPNNWSRNPDCESGGLFGWPWGLHIGGGKNPRSDMTWIVFSANPKNVINLGDKAKVVPGDDGELPDVVFCGQQADAMYYTSAGRIAWIEMNAGSASATGESGSASATGYSGSASATGWSGSASATGNSGSASASGTRGSASATGDSGSASASGWSGSASATGEKSIASCSNNHSTIEVSSTGIGAIYAEEWWWTVHVGAVIINRWGNEQNKIRVFNSVALKLEENNKIHIVNGEIQNV